MTELNLSIENALIILIRVSGSIFLVINIFVVSLIIMDRDPRGNVYRRFLVLLQISSTIFDGFCNLYAPIVQINCRLIYSSSFLSPHIDMALFLAIELTLFWQIVNAYFSCVYHRRNTILPPSKRFRYFGWRKIVLLVCLHILGWTLCVITFILLRNFSTNEVLPSALQWVAVKTTYMVIRQSPIIFTAIGVSLGWGSIITLIIYAMISELLMEIKSGMINASSATKRYQKRAVFSLVFQGVVPSMVYIVPIVCELLIYAYAVIEGYDVCTDNAAASAISALLFSLIFTHTFAHSVTVLACSPAYQRVILSIIRPVLYCPSRTSTPSTPISLPHKSFVNFSRAPYGHRNVVGRASPTRF